MVQSDEVVSLIKNAIPDAEVFVEDLNRGDIRQWRDKSPPKRKPTTLRETHEY